MKLETFFEEFEQFIDIPHAITRLRELLINLAVNGKLVVNNPTEEAVSLNTSILSSEDLSLPNNWRSVHIGDSLIFEYGRSLPALARTETGKYPVYGSNGIVGTHDTYLVKESAIIIGRKGSVGALNISTKPSWITDVAYFVRPPKYLDLKFTYYLLSSLRLSELGRGIKPGLNRKEVYILPIAIPPISEQKRIVLKLDEVMKLCDKLEIQQQEKAVQNSALARAAVACFAKSPTPSNLKLLFKPTYTISPAELRETILTLSIQGKLIPYPAKTPCSVLSSILAEASLNGVSKSPTADISATEVLRISAGTSRKDFYVDESDFKHVRLTANEIKKYQLKEGDLLACRYNGNLHYVGRFSYYREQTKRVQVNPDKLIRFRIQKCHSARYICFAMNAASTRKTIEAMCATTAGNIGVSARKLKNISIPLPSLQVQRRIVDKVDQLMNLVESLEKQLSDSRIITEKLLAAFIDKFTVFPKISHHATMLKAQNPNFMEPQSVASSKPLKISAQRFVLKRFAMGSGYRSLGKFDCSYHSESSNANEASPICLVGLNGSGKSNLIEALAEVFCFLELINLPWKKLKSLSSRYRENSLRFELEYTLEDESGSHLIRIRKSKSKGVDFVVAKDDTSEEPISPGVKQLLLLPRRIIGYSSGLNETVSHPFLRTKTIYSEEVRDAAPPEGSHSPEKESVFDTRTLYMDYESNAAIIICNYIFHTRKELQVFEDFTRVRDVTSFSLRFNRKRVGKSGPNSIVRLTQELHSFLESFIRCADGTFEKDKLSYTLDFKLNPKTIRLFKQEFKTAENLFMAMHKWSLLNALILSDLQRKVYLRNDITKGTLERPPSVPPSDRVFDIVDLKLMLSTPSIEIDYSGLSDGEHQFIQVFGTVLLFNKAGTLFLFDEPESHFNPEWRTKFNLILNEWPNSDAQEYIISTHSPYIISGSRMENVYKFTRMGRKIECKPVNFETYGASFDVLLKKLFSIDSLIDQSARKDLEQIIKRGNTEEMQEAVEDFAESKEKRRLYEALIKKDK